MGRAACRALLLLLALCLVSAAGSADTASRALDDLDGDGRRELYRLTGNRLTVWEDGRPIWRSPAEWRVEGFALGDADHDGAAELLLSLWKTGSFGEVRPFWHTGEDISYKNHLFVLRKEGDTFRPRWFSSDLPRPILAFSLRDADGDGRLELAVTEGQYRRVSGERYAIDPRAPARDTLWRWEEWGFRLLSPLG